MEVVGTIMQGEDLEPFLASHEVDVLILDVNVPASADNRNPYPLLQIIPVLIAKYPHLRILAISVNTQMALIEAFMNVGVHGYMYKDDTSSIQRLAQIVDIIAGGGTYFSDGIYQKMRGKKLTYETPKLTAHQLRLLSLCLTYPDMSTVDIATRMGLATSTVRNTLSEIYTRLGVHSRAAAIAKAQALEFLGRLDVRNMKVSPSKRTTHTG